MFAGKDVSIALAKMAFDEQYYNKYGKITLNEEEAKTLEEWDKKLTQKYK